MIAKEVIDDLERSASDIENPGYRRWQGYAAHERTADQYEMSARLLSAVTNALPMLESIVRHHSDMLSDTGFGVDVKHVEPCGMSDRWKVTFEATLEGEVKGEFTYEYDSYKRRWSKGLSVSREEIVKSAGISIDFLVGVESALFAMSSLPHSIEEKLEQSGIQLLYNAKRLLGHERYSKSILDLFLGMLNGDSAASLASIEDVDSKVDRLYLVGYQRALRTAKVGNYPAVPSAKCLCSEVVERKISIPAVYFAWQHGVVTYVGKSVNLASRLSSHHVVGKDEDVSWLPFSDGERDYAELYYIGLLQPARNNGGKFKAKCEGSDGIKDGCS